MEHLFFIIIAMRQEKSREVELNYPIMQAKRILKRKELLNNREWFIDRFKDAENHILAA